jgi:hypothetical protein
VHGDVHGAAAALDELWVVAPDEDSSDAEELAASVGARFVTVTGPSAIPEAFSLLIDQ